MTLKTSKDQNPKKKVEMKDLILRAALKSFFKNGYDGTNLRLVASHVGIVAPSIYNYFKNKQDLLFSCLELELISLVEKTKNAIAPHNNDPKAQLAAYIRAQISFNFERHGLDTAYARLHKLGTLQNNINSLQASAVRKVERAQLDLLRSILKDGSDNNIFDIDYLTPTAFAVLGVIENISVWFDPKQQLGLKGVTDHAIRMAYRLVGCKFSP